MSRYTLRSTHNPAFFARSTPALAYFLGFFWGDGYLYSRKEGGGSTVSIEILGDDLDQILPHFAAACNWNRTDIRKKLSSNRFHRIFSGDKAFYALLVDLGYKDKAGNHDKVLSSLSPEHHRYFFRGLLDADGSIGRYDSHCMMSMSSHFDQDWSSFETFCSSVGVVPKIARRDSPTKQGGQRRFSLLTLASHDTFFRFLDELYRGADSDGLYLPRKYHNYLEIKRRVALGISGDVTNRKGA